MCACAIRAFDFHLAKQEGKERKNELAVPHSWWQDQATQSAPATSKHNGTKFPPRLRKPALVAFGNKCDDWIARMKDTMPPGSILVKAPTAAEIRLPQVILSPCGLIFDHFVPGYENCAIPESKVRQWLLDFERRIDVARNRAGKPRIDSVTDVSSGSVALTFSWREGVAAQVCAAFAVELESIYTEAKSGGSPPQKASQVQDAKPASAPSANMLTSSDRRMIEELRAVSEDVLKSACRRYPHVFIRFANLGNAVGTIQSLSFCQIYQSPQGQKVNVPSGVALRIFINSATNMPPYIAVIGDVTPTQMMEAVQKANERGGHVIQAGFMSTNVRAWGSVFPQIVAFGKESPCFDLFAPESYRVTG